MEALSQLSYGSEYSLSTKLKLRNCTDRWQSRLGRGVLHSRSAGSTVQNLAPHSLDDHGLVADDER